ncbi:MAG: hypothetical protein E7662_06490 [Ruminococcaceae bacterium]|nr:hypothetical protein [Oscillospiraceae bacterium]
MNRRKLQIIFSKEILIMKKIAALLAVVMCLCALAAPVAALSSVGDYGKVPMYDGTITVDGKIDAIYKKGLKIEIAGDYGAESYYTDSTGNAYLLHDGKYIYVALEMDNKYPLGEYLEATQSAAHKETGFELYFDWADKGVKTDSSKFTIWANAWNTIDTKSFGSMSKIVECKSVQDAAKKTYVVEVKVSIPDTVKTGAKIGWAVAVAANDDPKNPKQQHIAVPTLLNLKKVCNAPDQWASFTLDSTKVADTTAATTKAPASTGSSAATFDAGIVLAVVAAAAGAGVVVSKKRH